MSDPAMPAPLRISARFRLGLAANGALTRVFVALASTVPLERSWLWPIRRARS